jgi:hypothetical protein
MGKFVLAYRGGAMAESPEEQEAAMAAWGAWFGTLGAAVVDGGAPFGASAGVGGDVVANLTGYSIVDAEHLDAAVAMAGGCPILGNGGTVEVYEALDLG